MEKRQRDDEDKSGGGKELGRGREETGMGRRRIRRHKGRGPYEEPKVFPTSGTEGYKSMEHGRHGEGWRGRG